MLFCPQVLTFLIDPSRFRYPERAIVFLAICYLVVGCAFVAGLGAGDSVSCRDPFPPPNRLRGLQMMSTITQVSALISLLRSFVYRFVLIVSCDLSFLREALYGMFNSQVFLPETKLYLIYYVELHLVEYIIYSVDLWDFRWELILNINFIEIILE